MPVLYKTLFIIVLAATGVASVYALGTTGAIEAGLAAMREHRLYLFPLFCAEPPACGTHMLKTN